MFKINTFSGQLVDVGSLRVGAAIAADPGDAVVLAGDPENVRAFFGEKRVSLHKQESQGSDETKDEANHWGGER